MIDMSDGEINFMKKAITFILPIRITFIKIKRGLSTCLMKADKVDRMSKLASRGDWTRKIR